MNEQLTPLLSEGQPHIENSILISSENLGQFETVDLNLVIRDVFSAQRKKLEVLRVISRCDVLPVVESNAEKIKTILTTLVNVILDNPPVKNKLFLYIKCDLKPSEILDMTLPNGHNFYQISFHANTEVCSIPVFETYWKDCEAVVRTLPNSFMTLAHTNTGCLFSITLPGKLN